MIKIHPSGKELAIKAPPSKSIFHRELIVNYILGARGGYLDSCDGDSNDIKATKDCLKAIDAVTGSEDIVLPVQESGSTLRFMIPVALALTGGRNRLLFKTEGRLIQRPLEELSACLAEHGITISKDMSSSTVTAEGELTPGRYVIDGSVSSQYISGLLMALSLFDEPSSVEVTGRMSSVHYIELTTGVLAKYGDLLQKALDLLETAPELKESIDIIIPMVDKMRTQLEDFTTLASLGLVSEMVSHDLGQVINRLLSESKKLTKKIENGKNIEKEDVQRLIEYIKTTATSVRAQLKHLNTSFKYNKENKATFSIREFVEKDEKGFYLEKLDKRGVKLDVDTVSDFYVTVNKGKMTQVFDNLINNSLYWLRKYGEKYVGRELVINVTIKKPFVYFEDNGWGVEKNVEDSIFEPFVTRKPVGEGRGLGLYIIKNLLNTDNCDVILAEDRNSIGQRYKFILNLSNIVEGNGEYSR